MTFGVSPKVSLKVTPKVTFRPETVTFELSGLRNANAKRRFFECKRPKRKPCHRGKSLNRKKRSQCVFLNSRVLLRKALNRNLSWGFPLGNLLPKTRVLKHRVLERKRRPNANASVLGTQAFESKSRFLAHF